MNSAVRLPDHLDIEDDSGLQRDPFQSRCDAAGYFDEAVRAKRLNLLFHLIPYSDVLLVTGEPGSGKTCILHRLLAGANDSWRICRFQAAAAIDGAQLLEILYKEFSLRPDAREDAEQRLRLLRESLHALRHGALVPVLIIDDAHLLTHAALAMLGALTEPWESRDKLLSVVMFGEPEISKRMIAPGLEGLRARISHSFDIPPLSEEDTGRYIRHRLQAAGVIGSGPFTDSVIKFIYVASRGFPGRINEFARVVLYNSEQKEARPAASASLGMRGKVYLKYGIAALLVSAAAVGLLYQDRLLDLLGRSQQAETVPPAVDAARPAPDHPPATELPPSMPDTVAVPDNGMASAGGGVPSETVVPEPEVPRAPDEAGVAAALEPDGEATKIASVDTPDTGTAVAVMPAATSEDTAVDATTAAPRDDDWLLAQDPNAYTLQLLVAPRAQCLAYIERHGLGDAAALYQTRSAGQVWSSLVYGVFATGIDASDAGKALSEQDINVKPWVRKMALVQARIREFRAAAAASPAIPAIDTINKGVSVPSGEIRREPWLREQSPEAYTLQLFSGKEANVMAYLKRHALGDQVALYSPADGAGRLTVTYGVYPDRAMALQAAQELAARLPDLKPWTRPLREIQLVISPPQGEAVSAPAPVPSQANQ